MALYLALSVALLTFIGTTLIAQRLLAQRMHVETRIEGVTRIKTQRGPDVGDGVLHLPLRQRILTPLLGSLSKWVELWAPHALKVSLGKRLVAAGLSARLEQYVGWCILAVATSLLLSVSLALAQGASAADVISFGVLGGFSGAILPELIVRQKIAERRRKISRALPDVLDLIVVSVNAGLGFDSALLKVTEKMRGPLSEELGQVLREIRMGVVRRDALRALAERTGVEDLRAFVGTIIQADQLGVSISKVLRLQADALRNQRRQRAEEQALKAPVKIIFPLVFFILPTLFIVVLGPAVLQVIASLAGM